jgi:uracil phosphoribosyltransferase
MTDTDWPNVTFVRHPLVQELLTVARDRRTDPQRFRLAVGRIAGLLAFEAARGWPTEPCDLETPNGPHCGTVIARELTLVPVLRAGLVMVEEMLDLFPRARVGHLGIYRDAETRDPVVYYNKLPPDIGQTEVIVAEPLLATAVSLNQAAELVKQAGAARMTLICLIAVPEGIDALNARHQNVSIVTAAIDEGLDEHGRVIPGLGDLGERLFRTA